MLAPPHNPVPCKGRGKTRKGGGEREKRERRRRRREREERKGHFTKQATNDIHNG